jgi:hypothetical protein
MRFFRLLAITILLLACVVLGSACAGAKGAEGPHGPKGNTGATGVGVENIVNNGDGTFTVNLTNGESYTTDNLTGPQGEQGEQGPQGIQGLPGTPGIGVEWVGEWDGATLYAKYDAVGYQGSSYISKHNDNTNHLPTDTNWWDLWVNKGETGAAGADGADGAPGADGQDGAPGPNMIVAMGVVSYTGDLMGGYNVTSCAWSDTYKCYLIEFTGMTLDDWAYVVQVTPLNYGGVSPLYNFAEGSLEVKMWFEGLGIYYQANFSFVVMDPDLA